MEFIFAGIVVLALLILAVIGYNRHNDKKKKEQDNIDQMLTVLSKRESLDIDLSEVMSDLYTEAPVSTETLPAPKVIKTKPVRIVANKTRRKKPKTTTSKKK